MVRFFLNSLVLVSILFFPWWVSIVVGVFGIVVQKKFYEIIFWALFYDLLYSVGSVSIFGFSFFFTVGAIAVLFIVENIKERTRLYV